MSNGRSWQGDWRARVHERVRARGFTSLTTFADSRPLDSFIQLALALGPADVNASQMQALLREEAEDSGNATRFLRSSLIRRLRERLPLGWADDGDSEPFLSELAGAIASWATGAEGLINEEDSDRVWQFFRQTYIPAGWLPESPDDPILARAFATVRLDALAGT
jgi:hypothetical protein